MDERVPTTTDAANIAPRTSRFELAPPRHFVLPAILLLLSEEPGYGYRLVKDLEDLHFGRIDRPSVYRALGQLENDALVESWLEAPTAGQTRRVYGLTPLGGRVLRAWMGVIKEERDGLDRVLRRYQATGTVDAVLAEVDGGWAALRSTWSPVSASSPAHRPRGPVVAPPGTDPESGRDTDTLDAVNFIGRRSQPRPAEAARPPRPAPAAPPQTPPQTPPQWVSPPAAPATAATSTPAAAATSAAGTAGSRTFRLVPARSVVLIEVRSSVGPISFGAIGLEGAIEADVGNSVVRPGSQPAAHVEIAVNGLRSGNSLYDAELMRRIDARHFPTATIDLTETVTVGKANRYRLSGKMSFHGVTRAVEGAVTVNVVDDELLVVTGEQAFDIRDFDVPSPTVLMLRIYPDVRVRLHVEAELGT
jgi:DNA-binding PadR family transcriptional regulator/polyisoprenoid-binding protein YceI